MLILKKIAKTFQFLSCAISDLLFKFNFFLLSISISENFTAFLRTCRSKKSSFANENQNSYNMYTFSFKNPLKKISDFALWFKQNLHKCRLYS